MGIEILQNLNNEIDRIKKENDKMQIELRHLKGEDITSLNYKDLMLIEDALENGLTSIRNKQSEMVKMMREKEEDPVEELKQLQFAWVREYQSAEIMPFAFRVQPMQPNLHQTI